MILQIRMRSPANTGFLPFSSCPHQDYLFIGAFFVDPRRRRGSTGKAGVMNNSLRWTILILFVVFFAAGCAAESRLEPAPGAMTLGRGNDQAVDHFAGIELIANPDAWRGTPEIMQELLPIKVIVRNRHGSPIRLGTQHFSLITDKNERLAAKAPGEIRGEVRIAAPVPYLGPSFYHHDFLMYGPFGYYGGVNRGMEPFYHDPFYYSRYQYWRQIPLPTEDMISEALPELTVPDGGEVSGFIYFEGLEDQRRVTLKMDLVEADGDLFGTILLPFTVKGG